MARESRKATGWVLLVFGAMVFIYGLLTMTWYITVMGGAVAGVGWAIVLISRRQA